jgi:hypothetical protein
MRALLALVAAVSLVAAAGACGSVITVPDQGVVVLTCAVPNYCYRSDCACTRGAADPSSGNCVVPVDHCTSDKITCTCPEFAKNDMGANITVGDMSIPVSCMETAAVCIGRGTFCPMTSNCQPFNSSSCNGMLGMVPPQLVSGTNGASGPALEPHCPYVDDVCCPGAAVVDAGATD